MIQLQQHLFNNYQKLQLSYIVNKVEMYISQPKVIKISILLKRMTLYIYFDFK